MSGNRISAKAAKNNRLNFIVRSNIAGRCIRRPARPALPYE